MGQSDGQKYCSMPLPKIMFKFVFMQSCRFCVGDRFYLCDNKILCENDYADRQMHVQLSSQQNIGENNNSEYSVNRNTTKSQASVPTNNIMPLYSEKNNFTNYDVPIHVR